MSVCLRRCICIVLYASVCLLQACSSTGPAWRARAAEIVDETARQQAEGLFPQEYHSMLESFEHGEAVLHVQSDGREADTFYQLAIQKGTLLKGQLREYWLRKVEEQRLKRAAEEAKLAEERLREQERVKAERDAQEAELAKSGAHARESQITAHTVRRGETLPQIAARSEIYNDASLWPIIYRANRDQIRDPKQLWPGQVLKIPRNFTRDEAKEAKRFSGKK